MAEFVATKTHIVNMSYVKDFLQDVWFDHTFVSFRKHLINGGRKCPVYKV